MCSITEQDCHNNYHVWCFRLKTAGLEGKDTQNLPPLVTGGLSPIMDLDEDIRDISGTCKQYFTFCKFDDV